jgi:hypothetical protein
MKKLFTILLILFIAMSCRENIRVRTFGGKGEIQLPKGQKLVNATWKETNMWILTKPMTKTDTAETYSFAESSSFGVWQGTYLLVEQK